MHPKCIEAPAVVVFYNRKLTIAMLFPQGNSRFVGCCGFKNHEFPAARSRFLLGGLKEPRPDVLPAVGLKNVESNDVTNFRGSARSEYIPRCHPRFPRAGSTSSPSEDKCSVRRVRTRCPWESRPGRFDRVFQNRQVGKNASGLRKAPRHRSQFENDGEDQRALRRLFFQIAAQIDTNFFLDNAPVGFFLGIRLLDCAEDHFTRTGDQSLAIFRR